MASLNRSQSANAAPRNRSEVGTGVVGTLGGALAFLSFLFLSVHVLTGLYATSIVTSAATDAARTVATNPADADQLKHAEAQLVGRLDGLKNVKTTWSSTGDQVGVTVKASRPSFLPANFRNQSSLTTIERTVWVRSEVIR